MTQPISSTASTTTKEKTTVAAATKDLGRDQFLKLLTYQLKSQDPMKPVDNQQFASQIAQFSQLEQLTGIRSLLEDQMKSYQVLAEQISNTSLPGMLGKNATIASDTFAFDGENKVNLGYSLPERAMTGKVEIMDSAGKVLRTIVLENSNLNQGMQKAQWDGKDDAGSTLPTGDYSFKVTYGIGKGIATQAESFVYGKIDAIRFKAEGTVLVIGEKEYKLSNIVDIRES